MSRDFAIRATKDGQVGFMLEPLTGTMDRGF